MVDIPWVVFLSYCDPPGDVSEGRLLGCTPLLMTLIALVDACYVCQVISVFGALGEGFFEFGRWSTCVGLRGSIGIIKGRGTNATQDRSVLLLVFSSFLFL